MALSLQEEEQPIDEQIANELIALTPESWRAAILEVTYEGEAGGDEGYSHEIYSPEECREEVEPSEELFLATRRLALLLQRHGHQWKRVVKYTVVQQDDAGWKYSAAFDTDPAHLPQKSGEPSPSPASGPEGKVLAGSKLEHQNASNGELQGYWRALRRGEIGILEPGPTTARGADYITFDPLKREIVAYDAKYRGPGGSYPGGVPPSKLQSWLPQIRKAIEAMPSNARVFSGPLALQQGRIRREVFKWPR